MVGRYYVARSGCTPTKWVFRRIPGLRVRNIACLGRRKQEDVVPRLVPAVARLILAAPIGARQVPEQPQAAEQNKDAKSSGVGRASSR